MFGFALDHGRSTEGLILGCGLLVLGVTWPFSIAVRRAHRAVQA